MKCKITKTAIITLGLLLPYHAFSGSLLSNTYDNRTKSVSLGASYKLSTPLFHHFFIKETGVLVGEEIGERRALGLKSDLSLNGDKAIENLYNFDFLENYLPEYNNSLFGLSFLFGYSFQNLRIELEGFYEKFDVKNTKNHILDNHRHVALIRRNTPDSDYVTLINNGMKFYSIVVNVCYDFAVNSIHFTPFICVGAGEDIINIFSSVKFKSAVHTKIGFSYMVSKSTFLFMDLYYHKVIGNEYSNIRVDYPRPLFSDPASTSAFAKVNMSYLGSEIGIRVFI